VRNGLSCCQQTFVDWHPAAVDCNHATSLGSQRIGVGLVCIFGTATSFMKNNIKKSSSWFGDRLFMRSDRTSRWEFFLEHTVSLSFLAVLRISLIDNNANADDDTTVTMLVWCDKFAMEVSIINNKYITVETSS
jgi:hypothetical protein